MPLTEQIGCDHEWVPDGPMIGWKCKLCPARRDGMPKDGPDLWVRVVRVLASAAESMASRVGRRP